MKVIIIILVILLSANIYHPSIASNEFENFSLIHDLNSEHTHSKVIIVAEDTMNASNLQNYLFVDSSTKRIAIIAGEYDLTKEEESFGQFVRHYLPWWSLWYFMKIIDKTWKH